VRLLQLQQEGRGNYFTTAKKKKAANCEWQVASGKWRVANKKAQVENSIWAFLMVYILDDIFQSLS
jgi:hypothetical protein